MKGETLIEVLIALTISVVVVTAIAVLGISSLNNAQFIKNQDQSTKYAQEGMELVRKIRNSDYVGFRSLGALYCFGEDQPNLGSQSTSCTTENIDDTYIRSVSIQQNSAVCGGLNFAQVIVRVSWTDGKCANGAFCHKSELTSCFSTVQPIPAP